MVNILSDQTLSNFQRRPVTSCIRCLSVFPPMTSFYGEQTRAFYKRIESVTWLHQSTAPHLRHMLAKSWCIILMWWPIWCMARKLFGSKWPTFVVSISLVFVFGSLCSFFHFIRRFWNQILICLSDSTRECAISIRRRLVRYLRA